MGPTRAFREPTAPDRQPRPARGEDAALIVGLVVGGVGIAGLAAGGVFGVLASSSWKTAQRECPDHTGCSPLAMSDRSHAVTDATVATDRVHRRGRPRCRRAGALLHRAAGRLRARGPRGEAGRLRRERRVLERSRTRRVSPLFVSAGFLGATAACSAVLGITEFTPGDGGARDASTRDGTSMPGDGNGGDTCAADGSDTAVGCPCAQSGALGCNGHAQSQTLICNGGLWAIRSTVPLRPELRQPRRGYAGNVRSRRHDVHGRHAQPGGVLERNDGRAMRPGPRLRHAARELFEPGLHQRRLSRLVRPERDPVRRQRRADVRIRRHVARHDDVLGGLQRRRVRPVPELRRGPARARETTAEDLAVMREPTTAARASKWREERSTAATTASA